MTNKHLLLALVMLSAPMASRACAIGDGASTSKAAQVEVVAADADVLRIGYNKPVAKPATKSPQPPSAPRAFIMRPMPLLTASIELGSR